MNALQQASADAQAKVFALEDQQLALEAEVATINSQYLAAQQFCNVGLPAQQALDRQAANQAYFALQGKLQAAIQKAQEVTAQLGNAQVDAAAALAATRQIPGRQEVV